MDKIHSLKRFKNSPPQEYEPRGPVRRVLGGDGDTLEQLCRFKSGIQFWMSIPEVHEDVIEPYVDEPEPETKPEPAPPLDIRVGHNDGIPTETSKPKKSLKEFFSNED